MTIAALHSLVLVTAAELQPTALWVVKCPSPVSAAEFAELYSLATGFSNLVEPRSQWAPTSALGYSRHTRLLGYATVHILDRILAP